MNKHISMTTAGCGAAFVSLLLFAGCKDADSPEQEGPVPPVTVVTATDNPGAVTIPTVDPPTRSSSSVGNGCGTPGVACTELPSTSATSEPSDTSEPNPDEQPE